MSSFEVKTRAIMLPSALHDQASLYKYSAKILDRFLAESSSGISVRLIGIRMAKFARKGTVSSIKKSIGSNVIPLDKFLNCTKNIDGSKETTELKTAIVVSSSHVPPVVGSDQAVDSMEIYSCNLFDASEDIENRSCVVGVSKIDNIRNQNCGQSFASVPNSKCGKQNMKHFIKSACTKSWKDNGEDFDEGSETKRSVRFNLESATFHQTRRKGSTSCNQGDNFVTKHSTNNRGSSSINANEDVICPICGQKLPTRSNINEHIDNCLTMIEVRNVLKEQSALTNSSKSGVADSKHGSPDEKTRAEKRRGNKMKDAKVETCKKRRRLKYDDDKGELQTSLSDFLNRNQRR